jgi:hypothetical protein
VRLKIRRLQEYYTELGEEATIEYEEEGFTKPEETFHHGTRCAKSSSSDPVTALVQEAMSIYRFVLVSFTGLRG